MCFEPKDMKDRSSGFTGHNEKMDVTHLSIPKFLLTAIEVLSTTPKD